MMDRLSSEHLRTMRSNIRTLDAGSPMFDRDIDVIDGNRGVLFCLPSLIKLAQMAVLPDEQPQPSGDVVTYGEWTQLGFLKFGSLFEDENGSRWLIMQRGNIECAVCAGMADGAERTFRASAKVRQIHLPAFRAPEPEPPSLEERAWQFIKEIRGLTTGGDTYATATRLLAEKKAQEAENV